MQDTPERPALANYELCRGVLRSARKQTLHIALSRPLPEHAHQEHATYQAHKRHRRIHQRRLPQLPIQPVVCPHAHEAHPAQDPRGQRIERAQRDDRRGVVAVEVAQDADADRHADRRDQRERERQHPVLGLAPARRRRGPAEAVEGGDARAEREALEHLVEEDHDVEGHEDGVAGDDERDAEEHGVEDDAGLEDDDAEGVVGRDGRARLAVVVAEGCEAGGGWSFFAGGFGDDFFAQAGDGAAPFAEDAAAPGGEAVAAVFDEEGDEGTGHGDGGGGCFVA